jgi:hypothetical protein
MYDIVLKVGTWLTSRNQVGFKKKNLIDPVKNLMDNPLNIYFFI